jgi:ATP-dependent helicase/nuclease subunit A
MSDLNPDQAAAADLSTSVVVSAGAGSGKTRVLTARWISALPAHGFRPDRLLAITFTEKAAGEMRDRLRRELDVRAADPAAPPGWRRAREDLPRAQVGTIHSFCASLLREFPLEAGVDPDFGVLEETDRQVLMEEVAAETVDVAADEDDPSIRVLAAVWARRYLRRRIAELLSDRGPAQEWAQRVCRVSASDLLAEWSDAAQTLREAAQATVLRTPEAATALEEVGGWGRLIDVLTTKSGDPRKRLRKEWEALAGQVSEQRRDLRLSLGDSDALLAGLLPALATLTLRAIRRYDDERERRRQLDFDSLQRLAADLLATRSDVRSWVRTRYDEVFVDEAQDTSVEQWSLIRSVACDEGGRLPSRGFFAVGDGQQSIYGFRGARPDDFRRLGAEVEGIGGRRVRLATSYRMRSAPLALTNHLAARLFDAPEALDAGRPDDGDPGAVELVLTDDAGRPADCARRLATLVVARLQAAIDARRLRPKDCALLLRSRLHLPLWEDALWRQGLPFVTAGGVGFFQRREILDLCTLLACLHDSRHDVALATVLRSPLFAVSDAALYRIKGFRSGGLWQALRKGAADLTDDHDGPAARFALETLTRLRRLAGRVPAGPLLRGAVEDTGYLAVLAAAPRGEQALANVEKLIAIVRTEAGPLGPLVRRLDRLIRRADRESQAALAVEGREGVRVMTVHASKGLEFPVVAVGDLGQETRRSEASSLYLARLQLDGPMHLAPSLTGQLESDDRPVLRTLIAKQISEAQAAEEARLLYVACTRARDQLLLASTLPSERRPGGRRPVDLLRDPLALGWTEGQVAVTLTASEVPPDALPEGLRVAIHSTVQPA